MHLITHIRHTSARNRLAERLQAAPAIGWRTRQLARWLGRSEDYTRARLRELVAEGRAHRLQDAGWVGAP